MIRIIASLSVIFSVICSMNRSLHAEMPGQDVIDRAFNMDVIYHGFASGIGMAIGAAFIAFVAAVILRPMLRRLAINVINLTNGHAKSSDE